MFRRFVDYIFCAPRRLSDVDRYVIATMSDIGASTEEIARTFGYEDAVVASTLRESRTDGHARHETIPLIRGHTGRG